MSTGAPFAGDAVLDRRAPTPLYFQLREALLRKIRDQGMKTGDRLPTESEIERAYGVSRATIRQALASLEHEGVVRRVQGLGTFVASPKIRHVPRLQSFSELARSQGFVPSHRMLSSSLEPLPDEVAEELGVAAGSTGRHLVRLLMADDRVVGLADTWLSHDLIEANEELFEHLDRGSLYELLQRPPVSIVLHRAEETISASVADTSLATQLECDPGEPVLVVKRISWTSDDRVVESTRLLFVSERYEYRVAMQPPVDAGGEA